MGFIGMVVTICGAATLAGGVMKVVERLEK